jgi:hypothetical protein
MTRRERAIARLERRREWALSRDRKASASFATAHNIVSRIPLGQPILVGHHSEKRHRAALDRMASNMDRGVESTRMAETHRSKAANIEHALDRSIFSDDRNAIEALQARITARRAECDRIVTLNKAIRKEFKAGLRAGWMDRIGATDDEKKAIVRNVTYGSRRDPMFPSYVTANKRNLIRADEQRLKDIERRAASMAEAEAAGGVSIKIVGDGAYAVVTFAEKPDRAILDALRSAFFHWSGGSWSGQADRLPECVKALAA